MLVDAYTLLSMEKSTETLLSQPAAVVFIWLISKNCGHVSSDCPEACPTISAQSAAHSDARRPAHPNHPPPSRIASHRARARAPSCPLQTLRLNRQENEPEKKI